MLNLRGRNDTKPVTPNCMKNLSRFEVRIYELHAQVCKMLSHPKRLEIIHLLRNGRTLNVSGIAKRLGVTKANASQHLAVMRQQHLVATRRDGVTIRYSLVHPEITTAYDALRKILKRQLVSDGKLLKKF